MITLVVIVSLLVGFISGFTLKDMLAMKAIADAKREVSPFSVIVSPYTEEYREEGWFSGEHAFKIGYQYQLMVHDIPCFEPHIRIEKSWKEKKIDPKKAQQAMELAMQAAESALALKASGVSKLFKLGKPLTISKKPSA